MTHLKLSSKSLKYREPEIFFMASPVLYVRKQVSPPDFCQNQNFWMEIEMTMRDRSHHWQQNFFLLTDFQVQHLYSFDDSLIKYWLLCACVCTYMDVALFMDWDRFCPDRDIYGWDAEKMDNHFGQPHVKGYFSFKLESWGRIPLVDSLEETTQKIMKSF